MTQTKQSKRSRTPFLLLLLVCVQLLVLVLGYGFSSRPRTTSSLDYSFTSVSFSSQQIELHNDDPTTKREEDIDNEQGRGVVICLGPNDRHVQLLRNLLTFLVERFHFTLPVELHHMNEFDDNQVVSLLSSLPKALNVSFVNLSNHVTISRPASWFCKPLALVHSIFSQVMLLDLDLLFLQSPNIGWTTTEYQSTGTLFLYDPLWSWGDNHVTQQQRLQDELHARNISTDNNPMLTLNSIWRGQSEYEQCSSYLLLDKRRHPLLVTQLSTIATLAAQQRKFPLHQLTYGDKELYWLAALISQEPYAFSRYGPAVLWDCPVSGITVDNAELFKNTCMGRQGRVVQYVPTAQKTQQPLLWYVNGVENACEDGPRLRQCQSPRVTALQRLQTNDPKACGLHGFRGPSPVSQNDKDTIADFMRLVCVV